MEQREQRFSGSAISAGRQNGLGGRGALMCSDVYREQFEDAAFVLRGAVGIAHTQQSERREGAVRLAPASAQQRI